MRIIFLIGLLILAGCEQEKEVPEGMLDRETFKAVLTEAQLIEARINQEMAIRQSREVPMQQYYRELFETYNTDREQFERTFSYYSSDPAELRSIYEEILTELSRRKDLIPFEEPEATGKEGGQEQGTIPADSL